MCWTFYIKWHPPCLLNSMEHWKRFYLKMQFVSCIHIYIQLQLDKCIMADKLSQNLSAINKLTTLLELLCPSLHCTVHAADESIKRLTNSRIINVPEVSEFLPASALQSILMDFKFRGKSTAMLNDALEGLDMKTVHMMSFCPTRMFYILTKCEQTVVNFVPIYDVIATTNLKLEKNAAFRSPKKMIFYICYLHLSQFSKIFS